MNINDTPDSSLHPPSNERDQGVERKHTDSLPPKREHPDSRTGARRSASATVVELRPRPKPETGSREPVARKLREKRVLSDKVVASLKPGSGDGWASRVRVPDDEVEGLAIVVYPSGTKSWTWERWASDGTKHRSLK